MRFHFFFGPDMVEFVPSDKGTSKSDTGVPFHGIISRGLLNRMIEKKVGNEVWYQNAHRLDTLVFEKESSDADASMLGKLANECRVLSFGQSAFCARLFIENHCKEMNKFDDADCEIWNIKEGHTSSVWKITILNPQDSREHQFVINVARDYEAGVELETTSEKMKAIAEHCPDINIAKVLDIQKIPLNYNEALVEVVVTKNEWIENSYEIHAAKDKLDGKEQYVLVERFLTKEESPSQITSIYGRRFSTEESIRIRRDIESFLNRASSFASTSLNINEGDVVWNSQNAVVVAIDEG